MDDQIKEPTYSFPNADRFQNGQPIPSTDSNVVKPLVHITDALNISKEDDGGVKTVRTFQNDIASAIKNDNVTLMKVALAEKKRQETRGSFDSVIESKKNDTVFYMASVGVAVAVVLAFVGFVIFTTKSSSSQQVVVPGVKQNTESIIYTETSTVIDTNNRDSNDIERLVARLKDEKFDLGTIKEIVLTTGSGTSTRRLTTSEFFNLMNARASDSLLRSLDSDFLMGTYSFSNPYDVFAVFKVNTYDSAFAGMLQWENSMDTDVGGLFISKKAVIPAQANKVIESASSTASTTGTVQTTIKKRVFLDRVFQNKDARALVDERGTTLMLYTFIGKDTLVIASSDKSLKEVIFRLTTGRIVR